MSLFDIDTIFAYEFPTSSIEYIRNYNFNTASITELPLLLYNSSSEVPITVDMTVTQPWVAIRDPQTAVDLRYPSGNVVLPPTSSRLVSIFIDLPPEEESKSGTVTLRPEIELNIKSGSFLIVPKTPESSGSRRSDRVVPTDYTVRVGNGQSTLLDFVIYKEDGTPDFEVTENELRFEPGDAAIISAYYEYQAVTSYSPVTIFGLVVGTTTLAITAKGYTTVVDVEVVPTDTSGGGRQVDEDTNQI